MREVASRVFALARLVMVDGLRRNALLGLVALTFGVVMSGLFFFAFVPRDIGRVSVDFVVTVGWGAGMIFLFFHAVQVMSWGEDRRVIHTLLAHPLSRTEYVIGVFSGLFGLLVLLNFFLAIIGYWVLTLIKSWVPPGYFSYFGIGEYALAWFGVLGIEAMILASIVLFSGLIRGAFTVLLVTVSYYLICNGLPVALEFSREESPVMSQFLLGLTLVFPDFSRLDYKGLVVVLGSWPPIFNILIDLGYVLLYCVLILTAAAGVYNRRDLK